MRLLVAAALVAAVLILARIIWGSPLVSRIREGFAVSPINSITECPNGSKMYMWEGGSYCCNGRINVDTDRIEKTCMPISSDPSAEKPTFCTLGPATLTAANCQDIRGKMLRTSGEVNCPKDAPNFVQGPSGSSTAKGRCCVSLPNEGQTDCLAESAWNCDIVADDNWFRNPKSCQFRKAQEMTTCPSDSGRFNIEKDGMTIFGCSNGVAMCYAESTLQNLRGMGVDTTGMQACKA